MSMKNCKYVKDINSPLGVCDRTGFYFNHSDLKKQMEWRGNSLVWTGLMVGEPFLDIPSEQNRPPITKPDPKPVKNARPPENYIASDANTVLPYDQLTAKLKNVRWG